MKRQQVLDHYFIDARHKLIDLAAFLDRVERAEGAVDFRLAAFTVALAELGRGGADRAKRVLLAFSDPTADPIPVAPGKGACGAWRAPESSGLPSGVNNPTRDNERSER